MKLGNINKLLVGLLALGLFWIAEPMKASVSSSTGDKELVADGWRGGHRSYRSWNNNYNGGGFYYRPYYYNSGYYNNYYTPYNSYYSPYYYNSYPYGGSGGLYFGIGL
ncbi:MAG: hypothetical protein WC222_07300 [Parachlamydiales bacterium]|jgi:hypothetical protein